MSLRFSLVADEFARRNHESLANMDSTLSAHAKEWQEITTKLPAIAQSAANIEKDMTAVSEAGVVVFPAMLALESLAALALAWATRPE